mmetsp:Transcript_82183/g.237524  ORF Transcript_82183/g.237524 Transcript_82183/m.237524 type:complete len:280 (+) Transcript_82183:1-840(+)
MSAGGVVTIPSPTAHPSMVSRLLEKINPGTDTTANVWLGDDGRLYIGFQYLRRYAMLPKIARQKPVPLWPSAMPSGSAYQDVRISSYIKAQLDRIWPKIKSTILEHGGKRTILLCGLSYGAVLSQAAALRFKLEEPDADYDLRAVTWNGFKWVNAAGAKLIEQRLGGNLLPLIVSERNFRGELRWDPIPHVPAGVNQTWAYIGNMVFVAAQSGCFMPAREAPNFFMNGTAAAVLRNFRRFIRYTGRYHHAGPAQRGMWKATRNAQPSIEGHQVSHLEVC